MSDTKKNDFYPSWRYHRTEKPRLVQNAEADAALGSDWADTPAAFAGQTSAKPKPASKPKAE